MIEPAEVHWPQRLAESSLKVSRPLHADILSCPKITEHGPLKIWLAWTCRWAIAALRWLGAPCAERRRVTVQALSLRRSKFYPPPSYLKDSFTLAR
jgi:hypothetical protein